MPALGELAWLSASPPGHDSLIAMPNQRVVWHQREALQIVIKLRLGWSEALRRKNRSAATGQPPAANWLLIACYENFFQQRTANGQSRTTGDKTGNSRGSLASSRNN